MFGQWMRFIWVAFAVALLACGEGCTGEIELRIPGCEDCPERCLRDEGQRGSCVECLKDEQCQSSTSPTRKCIEQKCVCGSDKDCPQGEVCAGKRGCVECRQDSDCSRPEKPVCAEDFRCYECKPKALEACAPKGIEVCTLGTRQCKGSGLWGLCSGYARCEGGERCEKQRCIPAGCPAAPCQVGELRCTTDGQVKPGRFQRCVEDPKGCPTWTALAPCPTGEACTQGRCGHSPGPCSSPTQKRCGQRCVEPKSDAEHCGECGKKCPSWSQCRGGKCVCYPGFVACGDRCVDLLTDGDHCGSCQRRCSSGQLCSGGRCLSQCPKGTPSSCGGGCFNTDFSAQHCGRCGNRCAAGEACIEGRCECPPGAVRCQGRCVDSSRDPLHCGTCNKACAAGQLCARGRCVTSCPKATPTACFGGCVDTQTNLAHCGACGTSCSRLQRCVKGACTCPSGLQLCQGACVDTDSHRLHCGQCSKSCADGQLCDKGACVASCSPQRPVLCQGACMTSQDPLHCKACNNACLPGARCTDKGCVCEPGRELCDGGCVDIFADPLHCGGCGQTCGPEQYCVQGACTDTPTPPEAGWTPLPKAADTRIIYVSSSTGDDSRDGSSPAKAVKSLSKGIEKLRDGKPDWLLLKRGDTWDSGFGAWRKSGASKAALMVVGAYGAGPRPLLRTGKLACMTLFFYKGKAPVKHVAFTSFHCRAHTRPAALRLVGLMLHHATDVLMEDLVLQGYSSALYIDGSPSSGGAQDIKVRRCQFLDSSFDDSRSSVVGVLLTTCKDVLFEENLLDNNGKDPSGKGAQLGAGGLTVRNCKGLLLRHNVFSRSGANGIGAQAGDIEANLFVDNPNAILIYGGSDPLKIHGNVVLHGNQDKLSDGAARNNGIFMGSPHSGLSLSQNIFAHSPKASRLFTLKGTKFDGNIAYKWGAITIPSGVKYASPERSLFTYLAAQGQSQNVDAFAALLRKQARGQWQRAWAPKTLITYFRDGFQKLP